MAFNVTTNPYKNEAVINGKSYPVHTDNDGEKYVIIDGKRVNLNDPIFGFKNDNLTYWPEHFVDYYGKMLEESKEKRSLLDEQISAIKEQIKTAKNKYDSFLSSIGVRKVSDITNSAQKEQAKKYQSDLFDLGKSKRQLSNSYLRECARGFDAALERSDWFNQLALAEAANNNLSV